MRLMNMVGLVFMVSFIIFCNPVHAQEKDLSKDAEDPYIVRKQLFEHLELLTSIPWHFTAAVDQYERTLSLARPKHRPLREGLIAAYITPEDWAGATNPDPDDYHTESIAFFQGKGRDGDGDGFADRNNDIDLLYTLMTEISRTGVGKDDLKQGVWNYYQNPRSVKRIEQFSQIYAHFEQLDLSERAFPLPVRSDYSYRSTWGAGRSYGGYRIHEGTDLFARYGVPVRSTCYGIIEIMGWNRYGGWRVGIRDSQNVYHYYAHLSGFNKEFAEGMIVKPGDVIGWVGSSGYGKPGTQGKFPPHLHYGMYRDSGLMDWSFDPYPSLTRWERQDKKRS